jgi:hypothetical protein
MNALALAFLAVLLNRGGLEHRLPEDQVEFANPFPVEIDRGPRSLPQAPPLGGAVSVVAKHGRLTVMRWRAGQESNDPLDIRVGRSVSDAHRYEQNPTVPRLPGLGHREDFSSPCTSKVFGEDSSPGNISCPKSVPIAVIVSGNPDAPFSSSHMVNRGRDAPYGTPPAQSRTSGFPAYGSHLGCLTAKRCSGQG